MSQTPKAPKEAFIVDGNNTHAYTEDMQQNLQAEGYTVHVIENEAQLNRIIAEKLGDANTAIVDAQTPNKIFALAADEERELSRKALDMLDNYNVAILAYGTDKQCPKDLEGATYHHIENFTVEHADLVRDIEKATAPAHQLSEISTVESYPQQVNGRSK